MFDGQNRSNGRHEESLNMEFIQYYSGSSGNLYCVTAENGPRLLLDPGVTWSKIQKALNYDLSNIEGVLISQNHKDHLWKPDMLLINGLNLHASKETFEANDLLDNRKCHVIEPKNAFKIGDTFQVFPFSLLHDSPCLGYIIHADNEDMLFIMETFYIEQRFGNAFSIIAIECNFDEDILQSRVSTGTINEELAKRIRQNHHSKQAVMDYLTKVDEETGLPICDISKCRELHLLHCSNDNIDREQARLECESKFYIKTVICKRKVT